MEEPRGEIVIYESAEAGARVEVRLEAESVWLSLNQMAELFDRDKSVVARHLRNVFSSGELQQEATVAKFASAESERGSTGAKFAQVAKDGKTRIG